MVIHLGRSPVWLFDQLPVKSRTRPKKKPQTVMQQSSADMEDAKSRADATRTNQHQRRRARVQRVDRDGRDHSCP